MLLPGVHEVAPRLALIGIPVSSPPTSFPSLLFLLVSCSTFSSRHCEGDDRSGGLGGGGGSGGTRGSTHLRRARWEFIHCAAIQQPN